MVRTRSSPSKTQLQTRVPPTRRVRASSRNREGKTSGQGKKESKRNDKTSKKTTSSKTIANYSDANSDAATPAMLEVPVMEITTGSTLATDVTALATELEAEMVEDSASTAKMNKNIRMSPGRTSIPKRRKLTVSSDRFAKTNKNGKSKKGKTTEDGGKNENSEKMSCTPENMATSETFVKTEDSAVKMEEFKMETITDEKIDSLVKVHCSVLSGEDVMPEHYRKYIRFAIESRSKTMYRLNKYKTITKEKQEIESAQQLKKDMSNKVKDIVGSYAMMGKWIMYPTAKVCKAQRISFLQAGVSHTCAFGKDILREFLKEDWPNSKDWENQKMKLWNGEIKDAIQVGMEAVNWLRVSRNQMVQRVKSTVEHYLTIPYMDMSVDEKVAALFELSVKGRMSDEAMKKCKPFLASFCLRKELESAKKHWARSNLKKKSKNFSWNEHLHEVDGFTLADKMTSQKFAFLQTILHNNIIQDKNIYRYGPTKEKLKFTDGEMKRTGGWSQDGLDYFWDRYKEDIRNKASYKREYNNETTERPDYFHYPATVKKRKKVGNNTIEVEEEVETNNDLIFSEDEDVEIMNIDDANNMEFEN